MNVRITPGLIDYTSTSGLCGNFDGNKNNDGEKDSFGWQILKEISLKDHRFGFKVTYVYIHY